MGQFHSARSISGFADHLQTLERFDKLADSLTNHIVVIGNQDSGGVIIGQCVAYRLAKRLKQLRTDKGLTQAALAERAGVTLSYIGRLEIGRHDPQLSTLVKLAKALKVTVAELLMEESRNPINK